MAGWWKLQSCLDEADPEQQHKGQPAVVADAPHHHSDKGIHIPRGGGSGCAAKVSLDSASLGGCWMGLWPDWLCMLQLSFSLSGPVGKSIVCWAASSSFSPVLVLGPQVHVGELPLLTTGHILPLVPGCVQSFRSEDQKLNSKNF